MPFPVIPVLMGVQALAGTGLAYSNYRATKRATDYQEAFYNGYNEENKYFWYRYRKIHHILDRPIRYPYRTGYNYNMSALQNAGVRKVSSQNAVYRSVAGGIVPVRYAVRPRQPRIVNIYNR